MNDLPTRKHPRLKGYDYGQDGAYFITFCTKDKLKTLGKVVGRDATSAPLVELTDFGETVRKEIEETHTHYDGVVVDKFVIMPNHAHMIVLISGDGGAPGASRPTNALIPRIVTMIKKKTNRAFGSDAWQRSYHDHIIRDEVEYLRIWQYIDDNPALWADDRYFVPD
jgi:REP element-mobilizing transposase RayT